MPIKLTVRIRNSGSSVLPLLIEPWGEYYRIQPGAHIEIAAEGPAPGEVGASADAGLLEIEHEADQVTVHGWSGSTLEVTGATIEPWPNTGKS